MRAAVRYLHSPDVSDLATWKPDDPDTFGFLLQIIAGPADEPGEESFDVQVCSPSYLQTRVSDRPLMGWTFLFVSEYDYQRVSQFIEDFVRNCSGETWTDVAQKIGRLGRWEFEDYRATPQA